MSSGDKVDTPASSKIVPASSKTVSPSSASCSHCGSLFIHSKGCRYCLPSKNRTDVTIKADKKNPPPNKKKRPNPGPDVKREGIQCVVPCCVNDTGKTPKKNFFFPTIGNERKKLWLRAVGVKAMKTKFAICEEHFQLETDLENYIKFKYYPSKWNRLKKNAIPTKFPCKTGKTGSYPEHDHLFKDLSRIKSAKKRKYPVYQSEGGSVAKKQKVVASRAIPSSKFGHPPELRSHALTQVEIVEDEPEKPVSHRDKFDFLNGDISNLIAHVQPSICSWDVSVVDVHSPSPSASNDCGPTCSNSHLTAGSEVNGGSDGADESETENEDATSEGEQENPTEKHLETEDKCIERRFSRNISIKKGAVEQPQLPATEASKVEQSSKVTTKQRTIEDDGSCEIPPIGKKENSSVCDDKLIISGVGSGRLEPCTTPTKQTSGPQVPEKAEATFEQPSSSASFGTEPSAVKTDDGSVAADDKPYPSDLCNSELISKLENGGLEHSDPSVVISTQERSELNENTDLNDKGMALVESELDFVQKINSSSEEEVVAATSSDGAASSDVEPIPVPTGIIHKNDLESDKPSGTSSMDCKIVDSAESIPEKESSKETQQPTVIDDSLSISEMKIDPSSDNSRIKVDSTKVKPSDDVHKNSSSVSETNTGLTSLFSSPVRSRVFKANCSCVMCGGISDGAEDDSEGGDPSAVSQTLPRTGSSQKAQDVRVSASRDSATTDMSGASSSKSQTRGSQNLLAVRTSPIPMKRILKKIEQQSDHSEDLTEDDSPETIESDYDSDSEWTPSEEEARHVPTRTTRNSVKAKNILLTRQTRSSEKAETTSADNSSPRKHAETNSSELENECESSPANKSSLEVNMSETVANYSLKKIRTRYSYKQLYEGGELNEETAEPKRSDKVLVVRDNKNDEFNEKAPLPQPMVDLLENMKTYFDHFFEKMDKLKKKIAKQDDVPSLLDLADKSNPDATRRAEQYIETLEEDVKMFPALLNLEMVQFVLTCKQHYRKKVEDLGERFKKIRWCASCPEAALFHCCFKAAYCSCKCQKKHWDEHKKDCAQERITLLDPHLRLNTSLMLRVKNLNRSQVTISDLEKSQSKPVSNEEPQKTDQPEQPEQPSKNIKKEDVQKKADPATPLTVGKKKHSNTHLQNSAIKTYPAQQRRRSNSISKNKGSVDPLGGIKNTQSGVETVELNGKPAAGAVSAKRSNKPLAGVASNTVSKANVNPKNQKKKETFLSTFAVKQPPSVNITLSPQFLSSLSGSPVQLSSRTTSAAASAASKATLPSGSLLLPKSMINVGGMVTTTAGSTNQVVVKFRSVMLPNGEKRLIPADLPVDQNYSVRTNTSLASGKPATSGSILVTRPAKPTYTAQSSFIPLAQVAPPSPQPMFLQQGVNGMFTAVATPMISQPPLPTLTPIPKQGSCSVRTLNDEELNKILNTDHLQSAFDDSYYANTRIRS